MEKAKEIIEVEAEEIQEVESTEGLQVDHKESNPTLAKGNYIIEVISEGQVIKKLAIANSEINVTRLADGGMVIDLK